MSQTKEKFETRKLPMMPIRDVVIFPFMMTPFVVGRESSVRALEEGLAADKKIFLATQHDASEHVPAYPSKSVDSYSDCHRNSLLSEFTENISFFHPWRQ